MVKILVKRVLPAVIVLALLVLGGMWLYGYVGVKAGWIGPAKVLSLNAISHSGADAAGGAAAAAKIAAKNAAKSIGL